MSTVKGITLDPVFGAIQNETDVDDTEVWSAFEKQHPEVAMAAREMARWSTETQRKGGGIFERDRYVTPARIFDQMRTAYDASESDDIVSGVAEMTESLAFQKVYLTVEDQDEEDIWNQIAASIELDARIREMWKELFTVSQFYCVTWWGTRSFTVKRRSIGGSKRKKQFKNLRVPVGLSVLDPLRIVPVGNFMFGQEQLAYIATKDECETMNSILANRSGQDEVIETLFTRQYVPSREEQKTLSDMGIESKYLFLLNPDVVWKHTLTKPQYKRFAEVRMKSTFELLDMKHQLRAMDRAHLIGGTNFIILVRKGSDKDPAKPAEIANLQANMRVMARVPVIVGDHRLSIDIITPNQDNTLKPDRYNALDARIAARLWQMFFIGNFQAGGRTDNSGDLVRVVARSMESRRHMLRRSIEKHVLKQCYLRNVDQFSEEPKMRFAPKQIALSFDAVLADYLMDLRDRGEISRETLLSHIDINQHEEALRRERESEDYDDIFKTEVPFSGQAGSPSNPQPNNEKTPEDPKSAGRNQGGNRNGGGSSGARARRRSGGDENRRRSSDGGGE